jgi:hypothetical protein
MSQIKLRTANVSSLFIDLLAANRETKKVKKIAIFVVVEVGSSTSE